MTSPPLIEAYPLTWPVAWKRTEASRRRVAAFHRREQRYSHDGVPNWKEKRSLTVGDSHGFLSAELRRLGATRVVVSSNLRLRSDGRPYADQKRMLEDPGVAVYFTLKGAARVLACDKWNSVADNLMAIGKHIEALRAVDRYGVGFLEQAFAGYTALPPAVGHDWRIVLGFRKDELVSPNVVQARYRTLAAKAHPDVGGDPNEMTRLNAARDVALMEIGG
jgi:hypothetical protein